MEQVHIRQQDGNPNLWWVSSPSGDDVAYITHLGNSYFVWATKPAPADLVGKRFDTVQEALCATCLASELYEARCSSASSVMLPQTKCLLWVEAA